MKFNADSPFLYYGTRIVNLVLLNFLWAVGCVPIVTAGASTIAAFTVTLKMAEHRDNGAVFAPFWTAWAKNLRHGVPLTIIAGVVLYGVWLDFQLFNNLEKNALPFLIVALIVLFVLLIHYIYVFPLEARYENTLFKNLANSRKILIRFFPRTLGLIGILVIQVLIFTGINDFLFYVGLFILPILMIYTTSQIAMPIFRKIEGDSKASDGFTISQEEGPSINY